MTTDQPDTSTWDRIDEHRLAHLDDQGSPATAPWSWSPPPVRSGCAVLA